jgi:hypothetical protein
MIPRDHQPPGSRVSLRLEARLDAATRETIADLADPFHQPRAAVVCHIRHWGLSRRPTENCDGRASEGAVRHVFLSVDTAWHEHIERAASAAGMTLVPWLRSRSARSP